MDILCIFTRGPQQGSKVFVEDAKNLTHALELVAKEMGTAIHKSNTEKGTSEFVDIFSANDFEIVHIRRRIDGENEEYKASPALSVKAD